MVSQSDNFQDSKAAEPDISKDETEFVSPK
jgi:hypothetical protein